MSEIKFCKRVLRNVNAVFANMLYGRITQHFFIDKAEKNGSETPNFFILVPPTLIFYLSPTLKKVHRPYFSLLKK